MKWSGGSTGRPGGMAFGGPAGTYRMWSEAALRRLPSPYGKGKPTEAGLATRSRGFRPPNEGDPTNHNHLQSPVENMYPLPRMVWIQRGREGSRPNLRRSR